MVNPLRVLIACEYSGVVRDAFIAKGHDAMSCDILPTESDGPHYQGDVMDIIGDDWDLMIAHPPCTDLASSGARWFPEKIASGQQLKSIDFFMAIAMYNIPKIAVENPIGIMSTCWKKPSQIIQPWMFGHGETKATCLWLKGITKLEPTNIVEGREQRIWRLPPSKSRAKIRSKSFSGIAEAMAIQWGGEVG